MPSSAPNPTSVFKSLLKALLWMFWTPYTIATQTAVGEVDGTLTGYPSYAVCSRDGQLLKGDFKTEDDAKQWAFTHIRTFGGLGTSDWMKEDGE